MKEMTENVTLVYTRAICDKNGLKMFKVEKLVMGSKRIVKMLIRYSSVSTDKLTRVFGTMTWWHSDRKMTISVLDHSRIVEE